MLDLIFRRLLNTKRNKEEIVKYIMRKSIKYFKREIEMYINYEIKGSTLTTKSPRMIVNICIKGSWKIYLSEKVAQTKQ